MGRPIDNTLSMPPRNLELRTWTIADMLERASRTRVRACSTRQFRTALHGLTRGALCESVPG